MTQPLNPDPGPDPQKGPPSRRTAILLAVAAVLAVIVVIGIVLVSTSGDDEPTAAPSSSSSVVTQTVTETPSATDAPTTTDDTTTTDETTTTTTTDDTSTTTDPRPNPGGVLIYDCGGQSQVRPSDITSIYCGDNSVSVTDISWSSWGPRTASGSGTENINLCRPNCAAGNYEQRAVQVELSRLQRKAFTSITVTGTDGVTATYRLTGAAPN